MVDSLQDKTIRLLSTIVSEVTSTDFLYLHFIRFVTLLLVGIDPKTGGLILSGLVSSVLAWR